jgi:hypothetical protein
VQFLVGQRVGFAVFLALPNEGGFFGVGRIEMAVQAVGRDIQRAVFKPRVFDGAALGVPGVFAGFGGLLEPGQLVLRLFQPKAVGVLDGLVVHRLVVGQRTDVRAFGNVVRRRKRPLFVHQRINGLCAAFARHEV